MTEPGRKANETESKDMTKLDVLVRLIDRYGLALVMLGIMTWFNYDAVKYERETMMPAIQETNKVVVECTTAMKRLPGEMFKHVSGREGEQKQ